MADRHRTRPARPAAGVLVRWPAPLSRISRPDERAPGAGRGDAGRGYELEVAGRRFRVVRVERLVRIGPDGPEGPRPSDYDSQPPVKVQAQRLREQGVVADDDEDKPIELDDDTQRLAGLVPRGERRRQARLGMRGAERIQEN